MRLQRSLTFFSIALLALTWPAHSKAIPLSLPSDCQGPDCNNVPAGLRLVQRDLHLVPRISFKPPKLPSSKPDSPDSDSGNDPGIGFIPGSSDSPKPDEPEDPGIGYIPNKPESSDPPPGGNEAAPNPPPVDKPAPQPTPDKTADDIAAEPVPADSTPETGKGSGDNKQSEPCKRGILGARCASSSSDDSEPVGAPARAQPPSGSWYEFVNDPSKVQNSRTQFNQRINNQIADDVPTGTLSTYVLDSEDTLNTQIVDSLAAGIGSILTALGRRNEISDTPDGFRVEVRSQNPPANGNPTRDEVQETSFTDDGKMIVAHFSDAANDGTPANEGKMPWDQLVFLQYKQLRGGKFEPLQFIGQSQISNKATLNTMLDAFERSGRSTTEQMNQVVSLRSVQDGASAGGPESQAFDALSWSDNVNGAYWLLSDFHKALGNKRISQIHLRFNNPGEMDIGRMRDSFNRPDDLETEDENEPSADILIELANP